MELRTFLGRSWKCPFIDLLPPLSAEETERLDASIGEHGILESVKVLKSDTDIVVDGHNRLAVASKRGMKLRDVPFDEVDCTLEQAADRAVAINVDRRHFDEGRLKWQVNKLATLGWSARRISTATSINRNKINDWLKADGGVSQVGIDTKGRPQPRTKSAGSRAPAPVAAQATEELPLDIPSAEAEEIPLDPPDEEATTEPVPASAPVDGKKPKARSEVIAEGQSLLGKLTRLCDVLQITPRAREHLDALTAAFNRLH